MRKIITILSIAAFLLSFTAEGQVKKKKNKAQTVQTDKKPSVAKNTSSLKGKKGKQTSKKMIAHPIDTESSSNTVDGQEDGLELPTRECFRSSRANWFSPRRASSKGAAWLWICRP